MFLRKGTTAYFISLDYPEMFIINKNDNTSIKDYIKQIFGKKKKCSFIKRFWVNSNHSVY